MNDSMNDDMKYWETDDKVQAIKIMLVAPDYRGIWPHVAPVSDWIH